MSYDISLRDDSGETLELSARHDYTGGTYVLGGTRDAWLNVTYNYAPHFYRVMGEKGIRAIYGLTAYDSLAVFDAAIQQLGTDVAADYWAGTEGNARAALLDLRRLAELAIADGRGEAKWSGD